MKYFPITLLSEEMISVARLLFGFSSSSKLGIFPNSPSEIPKNNRMRNAMKEKNVIQNRFRKIFSLAAGMVLLCPLLLPNLLLFNPDAYVADPFQVGNAHSLFYFKNVLSLLCELHPFLEEEPVKLHIADP